MESKKDDGETPPLETSPQLTGGVPPIPPHNGPPIDTTIGAAEENPEHIPVIDVASELEARRHIARQSYYLELLSRR